jgi:hypothetical protein
MDNLPSLSNSLPAPSPMARPPAAAKQADVTPPTQKPSPPEVPPAPPAVTETTAPPATEPVAEKTPSVTDSLFGDTEKAEAAATSELFDDDGAC